MYVHVLLVEDRDQDRAKVTKLIEDLNRSGQQRQWRLTTRTDADKALEYLEAPPPEAMPQVAIIDLSLESGEDGISLISQVSRKYPEIAILVWSQAAAATAWMECMIAGATDFISKNQPLSPWDLERHVLFALNNKEQLREHQERVGALRRSFERNAIGVAHEVSRYMRRARQRLVDARRDGDVQPGALLKLVDGELDIVLKMMALYYRDFEQARTHKRPSRSKIELGNFIDHLLAENRAYWTDRYSKEFIVFRCGGEEGQSKEVWIYADRVKLQCILENVLENAVNYQESKNPAVEINYKVRPQGEFMWAEISVRDHGSGLPEEIIQSRFQGANPEFVTSSKGWGVGLYFSSVMAGQHQVGMQSGEILATNVEHPRGALITVRIPFAPPQS